MGKGRTFRDDKFLEKYIDKMDRGELSKLIRELLHAYFTNGTINEIRPQIIIENRGQREDKIVTLPIKVEMNFDMFDD